MTELKAFEVTRKALFGRTCTEKVYLKSEADAFIAELEESHKKEVEQLLIEIVKLKEGAKNLILDNYLKDKEARHSNYKRCLAMADRWLFAFYATNKCNDKFYLRNLKLREIAEQFKEAK